MTVEELKSSRLSQSFVVTKLPLTSFSGKISKHPNMKQMFQNLWQHLFQAHWDILFDHKNESNSFNDNGICKNVLRLIYILLKNINFKYIGYDHLSAVFCFKQNVLEQLDLTIQLHVYQIKLLWVSLKKKQLTEIYMKSINSAINTSVDRSLVRYLLKWGCI